MKANVLFCCCCCSCWKWKYQTPFCKIPAWSEEARVGTPNKERKLKKNSFIFFFVFCINHQKVEINESVKVTGCSIMRPAVLTRLGRTKKNPNRYILSSRCFSASLRLGEFGLFFFFNPAEHVTPKEKIKPPSNQTTRRVAEEQKRKKKSPSGLYTFPCCCIWSIAKARVQNPPCIWALSLDHSKISYLFFTDFPDIFIDVYTRSLKNRLFLPAGCHHVRRHLILSRFFLTIYRDFRWKRMERNIGKKKKVKGGLVLGKIARW